jgi:hypothetical protein
VGKEFGIGFIAAAPMASDQLTLNYKVSGSTSTSIAGLWPAAKRRRVSSSLDRPAVSLLWIHRRWRLPRWHRAAPATTAYLQIIEPIMFSHPLYSIWRRAVMRRSFASEARTFSSSGATSTYGTQLLCGTTAGGRDIERLHRMRQALITSSGGCCRGPSSSLVAELAQAR